MCIPPSPRAEDKEEGAVKSRKAVRQREVSGGVGDPATVHARPRQNDVARKRRCPWPPLSTRLRETNLTTEAEKGNEEVGTCRGGGSDPSEGQTVEAAREGGRGVGLEDREPTAGAAVVPIRQSGGDDAALASSGGVAAAALVEDHAWRRACLRTRS